MSDNGPHNQPPQNPYGGGEYGEGQPPYGPPPGSDPSGGQPPVQGGPGGMPGQPGYGTGAQPGYGTGGQPAHGPGGQPGYGPQQGQPMYGGGQPPYPGGPVGPGGPGAPMGPGGPGQPPQPPQGGGGGSKASLWVVLGGGAVIIVLVVAVIVTLINNNSGGGTPTEEQEPTTEAADDTTDEPDTDDGPDGGGTAAGDPPYSVPTEPCDAITGDVETDFLLVEEGYKSVQDNTSRCTSSMADVPEGNDADGYGTFSVAYSLPFSNEESDAEATVEFERAVEDATGQTEHTLFLDEVMEEGEVDLGDEAYFVVNGYDFADTDIPVATLVVRTANLNIRIEYQIHGPYDSEPELNDFTVPDDIEEIMVAAGEDALAQVGS